MKRNILLLISTVFILFSCSSNTEEVPQSVNITLKFTHNWNGTPVTASDFNTIKFTNKNGEKISIERLRYVVSNITILPVDLSNTSLADGVLGFGVTRNFINLKEKEGLSLETFAFTGIKKIGFRFGFSDFENNDGIYQDLNSANFNVPAMLGGGYHYMQFDGKYLDTNNQEQPFNYHAIRAIDKTVTPNITKDTSFRVDLGEVNITGDAEIEIKMNIAQWFENPNTWDLNKLNTVLMPNYNAQLLISENGKSVFSLGKVTYK
ncbi:hypothetical protein WH52_03120 [Tenacibaculum holothuriorum]|uniref:Copper-binding protein MbnP-like domain-containing protein n=1 Tax=Tenacibaculum holothuriorum TaxID=1635173 RepID=A0A1Y2PDX6_9FLAO|nr:MbnP family protein [Tenacibaculum holothuriorum]OSY88683.1 hypothetical protein WH52_03120 [Tenacibaculum holothuriorum]